MRFKGGGIEKKLRFCVAVSGDDRASFIDFKVFSVGREPSSDIAAHRCIEGEKAVGTMRRASALGKRIVLSQNILRPQARKRTF